jgi:predicted RNA methylase
LNLAGDQSSIQGDGTWLSNSANLNLFNILKTFGDCSNYHFVDFGCGKGGVLYLVAAFFNFKKITGIEREIDYIKICRENLKKIKDVEIICEDVCNIDITSSMNFFYMCNPFGYKTTRKVLNNIISSFNNNNRDIYILYKNPVAHKIILNKGFSLFNSYKLKKLIGKRHWNYESSPNEKVNLYKLEKTT